MSGRLVYVVGPSGAGKDSVLEYARMRLPANAGIIFARRFITREPGSAGEQHIPLSVSAFERVLANGHFARHWDANGLRYGIGREISTLMNLGFHVVVNGSREHLPTALEQFQNTFIVCITAPVEVIRHRLSQRARENDAEIENRIRRATSLKLPSGHNVTTIVNDGVLETAGNALTQVLAALKAEPPA
jgi:ribose 1,5-bisphosphokinase